MDAERFLDALPELFDDFPRSPHPRGRRFDDIVSTVPNLAEENTLAVVNLAASLLDPGEAYLEAGTYMGASLIAAARGNAAELVAIDDFSFPARETERRVLPAADRRLLEANLERFGVRATILEGDAAEVLRAGELGSLLAGVFFYDASHRLDVQLATWPLVEPYLAAGALFIVDNADWDEVDEALRRHLTAQPRLRELIRIRGRADGNAHWWDGTSVLVWEG